MPLNGIPVPVDNPPKREPATSLLQVARAIGSVVTPPTTREVEQASATLTDPASAADARAAAEDVVRAAREFERWGSGVTSDTEPCTTGGVFDGCAPADVDAWSCADGTGADEDQPFYLRAGVTRTTLDREVDLDARARDALKVCEHGLLASEFWTGDQATASGWPNDFLANDPTILTYTDGGTPVSVLDSLAILEQALSECDCGARSMIHASPRLVTLWASQSVLRREGGLILTTLDTIVVTGPGYDGSGPAGEAQDDTSSWAYGTGLVEVRLGQVTSREAVDEDVNDRVVFAQRLALARFAPCCHVAINVDLSNLCEFTPVGP